MAGRPAHRGGVSYLVDVLAAFLLPDVGQAIHGFASILPAIAEVSMVLYLLVIGARAVRAVKTVTPDERIVAVA